MRAVSSWASYTFLVQLEDRQKRMGPIARDGSTGFPFCVQSNQSSSTSSLPTNLVISIKLLQLFGSTWRAISDGQKVFPEPLLRANSINWSRIISFFVCKLISFVWSMLYTKNLKISNKFGCEYFGTRKSITGLDESSSGRGKQLGANPDLFYLRFRVLDDCPHQ